MSSVLRETLAELEEARKNKRGGVELDEAGQIRESHEVHKLAIIQFADARSGLGHAILAAMWGIFISGTYMLVDECDNMREWVDSFVAPALYGDDDDKRYLYELANITETIFSDIFQRQHTGNPYNVNGQEITVEFLLDNTETMGLLTKLREMKQFFAESSSGNGETIVTHEEKEEILATIVGGKRSDVRELRAKLKGKHTPTVLLPKPMIRQNPDGTFGLLYSTLSNEQVELHRKLVSKSESESESEEE